MRLPEILPLLRQGSENYSYQSQPFAGNSWVSGLFHLPLHISESDGDVSPKGACLSPKAHSTRWTVVSFLEVRTLFLFQGPLLPLSAPLFNLVRRKLVPGDTCGFQCWCSVCVCSSVSHVDSVEAEPQRLTHG